MQIAIEELRSRLLEIFQGAGFRSADAARVVDTLVFAELTGRGTQGVVKLFGTEPVQNFAPPQPPSIDTRHAVSALVDGHGCAGPVVATIATELALERVATHGVSVVGGTGILTSTGALAYYAHRVAAAGYVNIIVANAPYSTTAPGQSRPMFGTNPIAFGYPLPSGGPVVIDASTSAITWSGLVRAAMLGETIPAGVAVDSDGAPTTDPTAAMAGAILPVGAGHKGAALALAVELLAGALTGSDVSFDEGDWGFLVIALARDLVVDEARYDTQAGEGVARLEATAGYRVPGRTIDTALAATTVELDDALWAQLETLLA